MSEEHDLKVDEELYSRQLYVLGHDAMRRMMKSSVLIVGLDGLGQEIAKDLCLAGVKAVDLFDQKLVTERDLGAGFYLRRGDVGKMRDAAVHPHLSGLNKYVSVNLATSDDCSGYDVVVSVNRETAYNSKLGNVCHAKKVKFVVANVRGLFAQVFVDLGKHNCLDKNGAAPSAGGVNDISDDGVLTIADGSKHTLSTGDSVRVGKVVYKVDVLSRIAFRLEGYKKTEGEAPKDFEEVKCALPMNFLSFEEALKNPEILSFGDAERSKFIHSLFTVDDRGAAMDQEREDNSSTHVSSESTKVSPKKICLKTQNISLTDSADAALAKQFKATEDCLIAPMCSIVGGMAAQEVLKGISGKFMPLKQFFYHDYADVYVSNTVDATNDRYSAARQLFSEEGLQTLQSLRVFLVGAGAIGCEHLKNFVMSGIGLNGLIAVTDMDSIEQSNLNRQFLFKESDVSKLKSVSAVKQSKLLNEDYSDMDKADTLVAYDLPVGGQSENVFSDRFLLGLDLIANALDNVEARNYMDLRSVTARLPMFDSGTLGTKGHVQSVIPFATESYSSSVDASEDSIPMCTIKSYPSTIEHTIEWAMGEFKTRFNEEIEPVENVEDCIKKAIALFVNLFSTQIQNLLSTFPADSLTKTGMPFWSPPKRPPTPISFNVNDKLHILFIDSCTNLYAACYNIPRINKTQIAAYLENVFNLCEPNPIHFESTSVDLSSPTPIDYDKDTWHVDFIYACANLRARNYKIKERTKHFIRGVSGKIIPAIATTTAVVSGLAVMEMIKYALIKSKILASSDSQPQSFAIVKNSFLDLGMPFLILTDTIAPKEMSYPAKDTVVKYNLWSRIEIEDKPLKDIIASLDDRLGCKVTMASIGTQIVYWDFSDKYNNNLELTVAELCQRKDGQVVQYVDFITDNDMDMEGVAVVFNN